MNKEFRAHPLMILKFIKPILFILVLPIIKAVIQYIKDGTIGSFIAFEILVFGMILFYGVLSYKAFRVIIDGKTVTVKRGWLVKQTAKIKIEQISSVNSTQNPLDAIFGAVNYCINTEAGSINKADFEFKVSIKKAHELSDLLLGKEDVSKVRFAALKVAIMAAATSSAFSGMLIGVPLLNRAGKLLGIGLEEMFEEITHISQRMETAVPPIVNLITLIILIGYVISFIYSFIKYINFRIFFGDDKLEVRSGFFVKARTAFKKKAIRNLLIIQTPIMSILKRYSIKVSVGGFGENKSESQVVVPAASAKELKAEFIRYFSFLEPVGNAIKPLQNRDNKLRFMGWPILYMGLAAAIFITLGVVFVDFTRLIVFSGVVTAVILLYYGYTCLYEYKNARLILGENVCIESVKGFRTCRLYSPRKNIGQIKITRFITDKFFGTCRLKIIISSEGGDNIRIRHIKYDETVKELEKCFDMEE